MGFERKGFAVLIVQFGGPGKSRFFLSFLSALFAFFLNRGVSGIQFFASC